MTVPTPTVAPKSGRILIICLIAAAIFVAIAATVANYGRDTTVLLAPGPGHHTGVPGGIRTHPVTSPRL
jgi:hypothetical protein